MLKDRYQIIERRYLKATRCSVYFVVIISALLALLSVAYVLNYAQALTLSILWNAFLTSLQVRTLFATYIGFFSVLFRHRNYESKNFHGSLELTFSIVVSLSLLLLVGYEVLWSIITFWTFASNS